MKFLVINGPNLNMMHFTEPGVAGQLDYNGLLDYLELCCTHVFAKQLLGPILCGSYF